MQLFQKVYADGLFQEQLSASFADRKADLIIKMTPPVVTTETIQQQGQKPIIQFKLYDPTTKEGYKHVTYYITIEKDGKKLLSDWFHDRKGDLKIEMKPQNKEQITVYGEPDPILQAFTGTENSPTWGKATTNEVDALGFKWQWNNRSSKHIPFDWNGP